MNLSIGVQPTSLSQHALMLFVLQQRCELREINNPMNVLRYGYSTFAHNVSCHRAKTLRRLLKVDLQLYLSVIQRQVV